MIVDLIPLDDDATPPSADVSAILQALHLAYLR